MLTDYRRQELETILTPNALRDKFKAEGADRESIYPMIAGWMESQQNRLMKLLREAYDEVDKLNSQVKELEAIAENTAGLEDDSPYAEYWDKHYAS